MTRSDAPAWLSQLSSHEIKAVLANPRGEFSKHMADRLNGLADMSEVHFRTSLDTRPQSWRFDPTEVEALDELRGRLDSWWAELSDEAQHAISAHRAGMVQGLYREAVESFGPEAEVPSGGLPLQSPFRLPDLILGYVRFIAEKGE